MLIPRPGALDITGLEPRNPFPLAQMVELRAWPFTGWSDTFVYKPMCVNVGMLASTPGALNITGLEPRNKFALVLGLSSLGLHAWTHGYWIARCLFNVDFVYAFVTIVSTFTPSSTDNTKRI